MICTKNSVLIPRSTASPFIYELKRTAMYSV